MQPLAPRTVLYIAYSLRATDGNRACKSIKPIAHLFIEQRCNYAVGFPLPSSFNLQMDVANLMSFDLSDLIAQTECDQKMPWCAFNHLL